ncbi:MAG: sulfite exporter TauE/SafE family protein [Candidatus Neomarinimicrobiota bacterium]
MITQLFFFLIGLFAGILSGFFGIGGGIVIVPMLILFFHFPQVAANGTSLAALLLPVGIFAVLAYHRKKLVDVRGALIIGLGIFIGVIGGSFSALELPAPLLKRLYGLFLLYIAWDYIDFPFRIHSRPNSVPVNLPYVSKQSKQSFYCFLALGLIAGVMAGLFGIGGGIIIVPALISIFKYHYKKAIGTSLMALLLPVGLPGVLIYFRTGKMEILPALLIGLGLLFGALFGALVAIDFPSKFIKRIYGVFVLLTGLNFIFQIPGLNN